MAESKRKGATRKKRAPSNTGEAAKPEVLSGALARGLSVLGEILLASQPLSLGEIAARTGLDQSTTLRLVRSLEVSRHVIRLSDRKRYVPSPQSIAPLPLTHPLREIRRSALPLLDRLAASFKATVVFVLYVGTERMVVEIARSTNSLSPYYSSWLKGPLHATGSGKALLLALDPEIRRELLGPEPYAAVTPKSLTTYREVELDLKEAAERGFVTARDEHRQGLTAIATNIADQSGALVGCLCVTCYSQDLDDTRIREIGNELGSAAKLMPYQVANLDTLGRYLGG